jgi:hypothetical protein
MKKLEDEFIPYKQALELKELSFNEPCFGIYQKNKKIWYCDKNNWITNFEVEPDSEILNLHIKEYPENVSLINGTYFLHSCANFTAPLYQQAFDWFREKYNLFSYVYTQNNKQFHFGILNNDKYFTSSDKIYRTYEEARLACLNKLIEIIKQKKL